MGYIIWITLLIICLKYYHSIPKKDRIMVNSFPSAYLILTPNQIGIQKRYECAAFSSAYVLRHFNEEADGNLIYHRYPCKLPDGTVTSKGITRFFKKCNYSVRMYHGNINTLKMRISQGTPIIVFIRVFPKKRYLHFVPVVGYDEEYFYLAESLPYMVNCEEKSYNRKVAIRDFEELWKIWIPLNSYGYYVIHK